MKQCLHLFGLVIVLCCFSSIDGLYCGTYLDNSTMLVLDANSLWIESAPKSPLIPTYLDFQGLRLSFRSTGQIQMTEIDNNNTVWLDGFSNQVCNATMNCKLIFQLNGNLVIYYASKPTGVPWSTWTNNMNASAVLWRTSPPYIQIVDNSCRPLKYTATFGARTTWIRGPTQNITVNDRAIPASRWRAAFGVNTHISHGWSAALVNNLTVYLGAGAIRDGAIPTTSQLPYFIAMKNAGVTLNLLITGLPNITTLTNKVQNISAFVSANPGVVSSIEGFNEINNFGFVYNNVVDYKNDFSGMFQAQKDLYSLVKANSVLKNIPVYDLDGGCYANGGSLGCGNFSGRADFGNIHNYPFHGEQPVRDFNVKNQLTASFVGTYPAAQAASSFVITEFGYHSSNFTPAGLGEGVPLDVQSILIVNYYLAGVKLGVRQLFQYELFDEVWSGYDGAESHFGLFFSNRSPKPVARALHFLSQLLSDANGKTDPLIYGFTNLPIGADYLLFQKSSAQMVLIVWNKAPVYDYISNTQISIPPVQVSFKLPAVSAKTQFNVYDIYSATANDSQPLQPVSSVYTAANNGISFLLASKAVVITIN